MAQNINDEKIEKIINETIIPDLEKLLSKEYNTDEEILNGLNELESKWKELDMPYEYDEALIQLSDNNLSKEDIYNMLPYSHIYIYVMKLITYLFFQNKKFETEISLLSSLNQICRDMADENNKELVEYIMEQISYQQDIAMAKDKEKEELIKAAMDENVQAFKNALTMHKA